MISENDGSLILALHRAVHATTQALAHRLPGLDLTTPELNVLARLASGHTTSGHTTSVRGLAAGTATKPSTLTSALDRLEGRGWVRRELDPADRRSFLISLTSAGQPAADSVRAAMGDIERACLERAGQASGDGFLTVIRCLTEVP